MTDPLPSCNLSRMLIGHTSSEISVPEHIEIYVERITADLISDKTHMHTSVAFVDTNNLRYIIVLVWH